jgi:D-alanyl-D-alanine carboxypeptidase
VRTERGTAPRARTRATLGTALLVQALCLARPAPLLAQSAAVALQRALDSAVVDGAPGIALAIVRDGRVVFTGNAGYADPARAVTVSDSTTFAIGGVGRTLVAALVLELAATGRLDLDMTAVDVVPTAAVRRVPNADAASLRQLLVHMGAVPDWERDPAWIRRARGAEYDPLRPWRSDDALAYARWRPEEVPGRAGATVRTSATGYTLLALAAERASGVALATALRTTFAEPLGLRFTTFDASEAPRGVPAIGHHLATPEFIARAGVSQWFVRASSELVRIDPVELGPEGAGGGMRSTASELALLFDAVRSDRLLASQVGDDLRAAQPLRAGDGATAISPGLFRTRHATGTEYNQVGSVLGFGAFAAWSDDVPLSYAILVNVGSADAGAEAEGRVRRWLLDHPWRALIRRVAAESAR